MKRATVEDIRKHDWFTSGCPTYLFPDRVTDTSIVDTDAIAEVCVLCKNYLMSFMLPGQPEVWC